MEVPRRPRHSLFLPAWAVPTSAARLLGRGLALAPGLLRPRGGLPLSLRRRRRVGLDGPPAAGAGRGWVPRTDGTPAEGALASTPRRVESTGPSTPPAPCGRGALSSHRRSRDYALQCPWKVWESRLISFWSTTQDDNGSPLRGGEGKPATASPSPVGDRPPDQSTSVPSQGYPHLVHRASEHPEVPGSVEKVRPGPTVKRDDVHREEDPVPAPPTVWSVCSGYSRHRVGEYRGRSRSGRGTTLPGWDPSGVSVAGPLVHPCSPADRDAPTLTPRY